MMKLIIAPNVTVISKFFKHFHSIFKFPFDFTVCYEYQVWECRDCGDSTAVFCPNCTNSSRVMCQLCQTELQNSSTSASSLSYNTGQTQSVQSVSQLGFQVRISLNTLQFTLNLLKFYVRFFRRKNIVMRMHPFTPVMQVLLNLKLKTQELKVSKYVARLVQFLSAVSIIYFSLLKECTQDAFFTSSKITKCNLK